MVLSCITYCTSVTLRQKSFPSTVAHPSQDAFLSLHPVVERTSHGGQDSRIVLHFHMQSPLQTAIDSHPHPLKLLPIALARVMRLLWFYFFLCRACYG